MKNALVLLLFVLFFAAACKDKKEAAPLNCVEQYLATNQLVKYTGQYLGCSFYMMRYELGGKDYFVPGSHCADMIAIPVDCEGDPYCADVECPALLYFYKNAVYEEIVGFRP